ncbi:MAG: PaaI family thioesterase [Ardenticatenaceae bacterium]
MASHQKPNDIHPFADLLGMSMATSSDGYSEFVLTVDKKLLNPHQVLHGGVIYSLADTGMGAAVYTVLNEGQLCATIEIKISYFKPVFAGEIVCKTKIVNKGRSIVTLESEVFNGEQLVAKAMGSYAIFKARAKKA